MSIEVIKAFRQKPIVIYPVYLDITGDYATAAALGQVLYWHETMHSKKFYKIDSDFEQELHLTPKQFRRVKTELKSLSFLKITVEQVPPKTFYDVDYEALTALIESTLNHEGTVKGQIEPAQKGEIEPAQKGEIEPAQKGEIEPAQKGQNITENTTELKTEITQNNNTDIKQSETFKNSLDKIPLLSLSFLNQEQTAKAIVQLKQLTPNQQALAIEVFNEKAKGGLSGFEREPIAYWNYLISIGKKGEIKPPKMAISQTTELQATSPQKPAMSLKERENTRLECIKVFVASKKADLLKEFAEHGFVTSRGIGMIIEPDLRLAGLFD
jgi:hypothetical protein